MYGGYGPLGSPERVGPAMQASSKLPTELRPIHYRAPGLQATREAAGLSREELGERTGYGAGVVAALEAGGQAHTVTASRLAAACGEHDLRVVRDES